MAHHKGQGSTDNGRDSESKRLGMKRADGQLVQAKITGTMKVERMGRDKKKISVYPEVEGAKKSEEAPKAKSKKVNA